MIDYFDEVMTQNRKTFILSDEVTSNNVRKEILESWVRSKRKNIDPWTSIFTQPLSKEIVTKRYENLLSYRTQVMFEVVDKFYTFLEHIGSVLFGADPDLTIIVQRGSRTLLQELNSKNIGLGSSLKEDIVGTNAAALALYYQTEVNVIGAEHYVDALQDYSCSAVLSYNEQNELLAVNMLVTPKNNFNPCQLGMLSQFTQLILAEYILHMHQVELALIYEHVNHLLINQNDIGLILVNSLGNVLSINKPVMNFFGIDETTLYGKQFEDTFPELRSATDCLKNGKSIFNQEVYCNRQPLNLKTLKMECHATKTDNCNIGLIITLQDKKGPQKNTIQKTNFKAHFSFDDLIGFSPIFLATKKAAEKSAHSFSNTLIVGESGTGKELFAQSIHNASNRANGPFVSVNCSAIPKELIESELFGYMEGAFTGARKNGVPGKFELADKGTLFLDEIGEMPLAMQSVLLRVLEEKTVTRLGGCNPIPIDVKFIAATNRDILKSVESQEFRLDLYYRLNVIKFELSPLRERKEDIPILIDYYLKEISTQLHKIVSGVTPEVNELLKNYYWPGNVRELRNVLERGINLSDSDVLTINDLPKEILISNFLSQTQSNDLPNDQLVNNFMQTINERHKISDLMVKYNGNKTLVAKDLGLTRAALYRRLKAMGKQYNR